MDIMRLAAISARLCDADAKEIADTVDTCKRQALKLERIRQYCKSHGGRMTDERQLGIVQACEYIKGIIESEVKP